MKFLSISKIHFSRISNHFYMHQFLDSAIFNKADKAVNLIEMKEGRLSDLEHASKEDLPHLRR